MRENTVDIIKILSTGKGTDRLCRSPRNHHGLCCPLSLEASTGVDGVGPRLTPALRYKVVKGVPVRGGNPSLKHDAMMASSIVGDHHDFVLSVIQ